MEVLTLVITENYIHNYSNYQFTNDIKKDGFLDNFAVVLHLKEISKALYCSACAGLCSKYFLNIKVKLRSSKENNSLPYPCVIGEKNYHK